MTTVKRILIAFFSAACALLLLTSGAFLVVDDETLVNYLVERIESLSDTRISYGANASVSRAFAPTLSVRGIVVDDVGGRYRVETRSLELQLSLPWLLAGRLDIPRLSIGDTRIHVLEGATTDKPDPAAEKPAPLDFSALRLKPVIHEVDISALSILLEGDAVSLPAGRIAELSLRLEPGNEVPALSAQLEVVGETLFIDATLPNLYQALDKQQLPFSVSVKGVMTDVSLVGGVDFSRPEALLQADFHAHTPNLETLPSGIEGMTIPGELVVKAQLSGPLDGLAAEDVSAQWSGPGESTLALQGRIGSVIEFEGVDLGLDGRLDHADWLAPALPDGLGSLVHADVSARISGDRSRLNVRQADLSARTPDELELSFSGGWELVDLLSAPEAENIDLHLVFAAPTTRAARALLFDDIPEFGAISGSLDIRSTRGDPSHENIVLQARDAQGIQVDLKGGIARFPLSPDESNTGYDLDVVMKADQASLMAERLGMDIPLSGPVDLRYRIEGDTQALRLNQVKLSAGKKKLVLINARGGVSFGPWDRQDPLEAIDLMIDWESRDAGLLRAVVEQDLPAIAYRAGLHLHTVDGQHRIDDFTLSTQEGEPLVITETGSAERVTFLPAFDIQGIRVLTKAATDDTAKLNALFRLKDKIPALGPLQASVLVTGSNEKLLISEVSLTAGREEVLSAKMEGRLGYISAEQKWRLQDTDLAVSAQSASSQAFAAALGYRLPPLGPVSAQASLHDKNKTLGVHDLQLRVGDNADPALIGKGFITDLYKTSGIRIDAKLNLDGRNFAGFADKHELPELAALTGDAVVSDADGTLGIDSLELQSHRSELLSLKVDGRFGDFKNPESLSLNSHVFARDLQILGALFDREWSAVGPVRFEGQVKLAGDRTRLDASLVLGEASADMALSGEFDASPPSVNGAITARHVFLRDPFEKAVEKRAAERKKRKPSSTEPVFSRSPLPFEWLKKADLDLSIDIESFDRTQWEAESARFGIALKSGHLSIRPASFVYGKGTMELDLQVDAKDQPQVSFKASADSISPWQAPEAGKKGAGTYLDADWDLDLSLSSKGETPHELASNARGDIYMTVKNGKMRRAIVNLLFVDIVGWSVSLARQEKFVDVNCGVADFNIEQGVVSTHAFFLDTPSITITGEGTIDLGEERIDYAFIPRKKSRVILKAEPVAVKGPLNDPTVKAIPVKSAALTFGTLVFAPYIFAGTTAAGFLSGKLDKDDSESPCLKYEKARQEGRVPDSVSPASE